MVGDRDAETTVVFIGEPRRPANHIQLAIDGHRAYLTIGRIHKTLRVTLEMEAGISDHVWSLEEIATLAN